ncbi:GNAT family N-acetyltransferase [Bacillus weihaiensis]|uniref:GNAT family N-acetyltransferase n=1 Tax=Bacillus weihaiensis TaxID=1547283 RepID=UPI003F6AD146
MYRQMKKENVRFTLFSSTEYWESSSNFIEKGTGYCILYNGKVVSECTSIFSN